MTSDIEFGETINFEDPSQKNKIQLDTKIFTTINGKQVPIIEETGFIFQKYSGFAPKKYNEEAKRDFIKITLDPEQESCNELRKILNRFDECFHQNKNKILGENADKNYEFLSSVKSPSDEKQVEGVVKHDNCKMKLKMDWFYYYDGERLDKLNTSKVKKTIGEFMVANKDKVSDPEKRAKLLNTLTFELEFKEDDAVVKKIVKMSDLEQKREIDTKIFYRRPETIHPNAIEFLKKNRGTTSKEIEDYETELVNIFGDPQDPQDIRTGEQLDKFYNYNCYIRILFSPYRVWASRSKEGNIVVNGNLKKVRKTGIKYVINTIDIIQLPYENNYSSNHKMTYSKYAFGRIGNDEHSNSNIKNVESSMDTPINTVSKTEEKTKSDAKADTKSKKENVQISTESDDDEEEESGSDEEESDSDEEESGSDDESDEDVPPPTPTPVKKGAKTNKIEVEASKAPTKVVKKTK